MDSLVRTRTSGGFNLLAFKKAWRRRLNQITKASDGKIVVDPDDGVSGAQLALLKAEANKTTHQDRQSRMVRRFASGHDNFKRDGVIDWKLVSSRADRDWWQHGRLWYSGRSDRPRRYKNSPYEEIEALGDPPPPPEECAFQNVFRDAMDAEAERFLVRLAQTYRFSGEDGEFVKAVAGVLFEERARRELDRSE